MIVPPGLGKSRIATSVIVLSDFAKVVVAYANEVLRANDEQTIEAIRTRMP